MRNTFTSASLQRPADCRKGSMVRFFHKSIHSMVLSDAYILKDILFSIQFFCYKNLPACTISALLTAEMPCPRTALAAVWGHGIEG